METRKAVSVLAALAHEGRVSIFRELIQAGPEGLAAGELARRVEIAPNTLSGSLTVLSHAELVTSRRAGKSVIYTANYDRMSALLMFLMQDCCQGRPEVCAPMTAMVAQAACCIQPEGTLS